MLNISGHPSVATERWRLHVVGTVSSLLVLRSRTTLTASNSSMFPARLRRNIGRAEPLSSGNSAIQRGSGRVACPDDWNSFTDLLLQQLRQDLDAGLDVSSEADGGLAGSCSDLALSNGDPD
jgi:hypothetical protein